MLQGFGTRAALEPVVLLAEHLREPQGLGTATPRLSWQLVALEPELRGLAQSAYQIQVASSEADLTAGVSDLWDSGRVASSRSIDVPFGGAPLLTDQRAVWRVRVWDQAGRESPWSSAAQFSVGILDPEQWQAQWIGFDRVPGLVGPRERWGAAQWLRFPGERLEVGAEQCSFRRTFELEARPTRARLLLTADDQWAITVNGRAVAASTGASDAWRHPSEVDIAAALMPGANRLQVVAKNDRPGAAGLIARLELEFADGSQLEILSDCQFEVAALDGNFGPAVVEGPFGCPPWGELESGLRLPPVRYLRRGFELEEKPLRATLHGTALGLVDFQLNGKPVGDACLLPGWTDYEKRVYARSFDVTEVLEAGANALSARLADGWYSGYVGYGGRREHYGISPRLCAELHLEFADGRRQVLLSDGAWRAATGGLLEADLLMGEAFDARLEPEGWQRADFDDSAWAPVSLGATQAPLRQPHPAPPIRPVAEFTPREAWKVAPGSFVFDLGQNIAGVVRLSGSATAGQRFSLRHAERLTPERQLYTQNLRGARATDRYIAATDGPFVFEPRFTFHGFQYVEVSGLDPALDLPPDGLVTGVAWTSDLDYGLELRSSEPALEQLASNIAWTQRMNFLDVPTDCPQRDERLGWTGDALIYGRTAAFNADARAFYDKWLIDLTDAQRADGQFPMVAPLKVAGDDGGPAWADVGAILPWELFEFYGDRQMLERQYPSMRRFVDFCVDRCRPGLVPPEQFHCFGDWVNLDADTPKEVIFSAFLARSAECVARTRAVLDGQSVLPPAGYRGPNSSELEGLSDLWRSARLAFQRQWVDAEGRVEGETQCAYALALAFDLLDEPHKSRAAQHLVADIEARGWHFSTGFVGTRVLLQALTRTGHRDVAARLVLNRDYPSWLFAVDQGATSIWERWDGWTEGGGFQDPGMNSFAHYAFGCVGEWLVESGAGLGWGTDTWDRFAALTLRPKPLPGLERLSVRYASIFGPVVCGWRTLAPGEADADPQGKAAKAAFELQLEVPPNLIADLELPMDCEVLLDGQALEWLYSDGRLVSNHPDIRPLNLLESPFPGEAPIRLVRIASGSYHLLVRR